MTNWHIVLKLACFTVLFGLAFWDAYEKRKITSRFVLIQIGIAILFVWLVISN